MSFNKALAIDSVTITDLTDAIVSIEEPINPANGTLWIDISGGEEEGVLKQYIIREGEDKGQWITVKLNMEYLNPEMAETVKTVNQQLTNMGDDGLLTYNERVELAKMIAEITGETPSTTSSLATGYKNSLPTAYTLDSGNSGGSYYKYRYSARQVGIDQDEDKGNPIYKSVETSYNELSDYLSNFKPKPWDITVANKEQVVELGDSADKLREVFLNYYTSALALSELTKERGVEVSKKYTDEGIDNIDIGGTNLISTEKAEEGKTLNSNGSEISNILYDLSDFIEVVGGKDYSASVFVTPQTSNEFIKYAWYDSERNFISSGGTTDTSVTMKAPDNAKYIRVAYLKDTKPKFESGNKPTDWSPNPEDIESQIEHTQASLTVTSNAIRGIVLETIGGAEVATIDEETGEIVYIDTRKTRLSQLEQKSDSITLSVTENTGAISKIEQRVDGIVTTVSNNTGAISEVNQRVDKISTRVSNNAGAISRVEQTANGIESTVSKIDNGSYIVSKINQSADGVLIKGKNIELDGDTKVKGSLRISGNIITGGTITSTNINLLGGYINSNSKGAWISGTETEINANNAAVKFNYAKPALEVEGRIDAMVSRTIQHALEFNGLSVHNGRGWFKYTTGHQSVDIGVTGEKIRLMAPITQVTGTLDIAASGGGRHYDNVSLKMYGMESDIAGMSGRLTRLEAKVK